MRDYERRREQGGDVFVLEWKKNSALFFHSRSHCLLFLISVYPVAWQADGSDYTVIINQVRKPWKRWRDDRGGGGRRKGDLRSAHGPAHVSIGPENQRPCSFPSKWRLRPTSKHHERNQEYCLIPKICISFSAAVRSHFDHTLIRIDSACKCFALILKDELCSLWSKKFTSLPSNLSFSSTVPVFFSSALCSDHALTVALSLCCLSWVTVCLTSAPQAYTSCSLSAPTASP